MKKTTVTIGIPAYQAEQNIKNLLISLVNQKTKLITIESILVYADGCTDNTVKNAKSVNSNKIQVIAAKKNKGFAFALQSLIKKNQSRIFVILNDDIRIDSFGVIEELVKPLIRDRKAGLVGGNIRALPPQSFIGRCIYASYLTYLPLRYGFRNGETDLTCDGKILALRKEFAGSLNLTKLPIGNVDIYLYYEALKKGWLYKFAKKAVVVFRLPETVADFRNQEIRAEASRRLVKELFGSLYIDNNKLSFFEYLKSALNVFAKYPIETLFYKFYLKRQLKVNKRSYSKWKLALTTKKLSLFGIDIESLLHQL